MQGIYKNLSIQQKTGKEREKKLIKRIANSKFKNSIVEISLNISLIATNINKLNSYIERQEAIRFDSASYKHVFACMLVIPITERHRKV